MPEKKIESLEQLKSDPRNARKRTERSHSMIVKSLEQFGGMRSIVVDEDNMVRAGNGTLEAATQIGIEKVRVIEADGNELIAVKRKGLTEEQWKQYAIADNRSSDLSEWDADVLAELAGEVDLSDFFFPDELANFLPTAEPPTAEEDEETTADLMEQADAGAIESRVSLGQIWQIGRHRICCGDSTDEGNVRKLLGDRFKDVGMVWADPPYGMNLDTDFPTVAKSRRDFAEEKSAPGGNTYAPVIGDSEDFDPRPLIEMFPKVKEQYWWGADYYAERLPNKNTGSWLIWDKRVEESMDAVYGSVFETCWSKARHKRAMIRIKWAGIFGMEKEDTKKRVHPTQKPYSVPQWIFEKYGKPNDLIFDPFLGSAPSIIAAQQMEGDRTVYGFELSEAYCEVVLQRFSKFSGIEPVLVGRLD